MNPPESRLDQFRVSTVPVTLTATWQNVRADAARYPNWIGASGFWVSLSYRLRRLRKAGRLPWRFLLVIDLLLGVVKRAISDTTIPAVVDIGAGLYLPHPQGIVINHKAKIGAGVAIFQQVTIGEWRGNAPVISNGVAIYGGAKIFGNIKVGCGSMIGCNAVVSRDIPDFSIVSVAMPEITPGRTPESSEISRCVLPISSTSIPR